MDEIREFDQPIDYAKRGDSQILKVNVKFFSKLQNSQYF